MCVCIKCNSQIGYYLILVDNWVLNIGEKTLVQLALDSLISCMALLPKISKHRFWVPNPHYLYLCVYHGFCECISIFFYKQNNYAVKVAFFLRNGSINTRYFFSTSFKISRRFCGFFFGDQQPEINLLKSHINHVMKSSSNVFTS